MADQLVQVVAKTDVWPADLDAAPRVVVNQSSRGRSCGEVLHWRLAEERLVEQELDTVPLRPGGFPGPQQGQLAQEQLRRPPQLVVHRVEGHHAAHHRPPRASFTRRT